MTWNTYDPQNSKVKGRFFTGTLDDHLMYRNRRHIAWIKNGGAATVTAVGCAAPTLSADTGSPASSDGTNGPSITLFTTAVNNDSARLISSTLADVRRDWRPDWEARIETGAGANTAAIRLWAGLASANPEDVATLLAGNIHGACFRYDTVGDTTAFWRCVTGDNNTVDTETITTVAVAIATSYVLRIVMSDTTIATPFVDFYINGTKVATHTTHLPTSATAMGPIFTVTALGAAIKRLIVGRMQLSTN